MQPVSARLPAPVQTGLAAVRVRAAAFPGPVVDLSIGAPVDPTPDVVQRALVAEGNAPGYPLTVGRLALREAYVGWLARRHDVTGLEPGAVLPVIGTKELIGSIALHLGLGPDALVAHPVLAYPTYAVGAALVGARTVVWCRERGTLLVSDECYLDLGWDGEPPVSVLRPDVCDGRHDGVLAVHSLSKRSNLAGYRCGFVSGDAAVVAELLKVRRNLGLQVPEPQQGVAVAALDDDEHVTVQRGRYARRRAVLLEALTTSGFRVDHSEAGLYLWATRDEPSDVTVGALADLGIVVVNGREYGAAGARHVRLALTAPDADVDVAAQRLRASATLAP